MQTSIAFLGYVFVHPHDIRTSALLSKIHFYYNTLLSRVWSFVINCTSPSSPTLYSHEVISVTTCCLLYFSYIAVAYL